MKATTLAAGLTLTLLLPALGETPKVIQQVRHTGAGTQIVIKDYRPGSPRVSHAVSPAFKEYDLTAPAASAAPSLRAVPQAPAPVVRQQAPPQVQMYSQQFAPGPNTGMANNGFWTPGGASILSTGPIWGNGFYSGYGFAGGLYGAGYGYAGGGYGYGRGYGYGYGNYAYQPNYLNSNMINTPQQRFNPVPGMHPYSLNPVAPQSFYPGGYGPGYGFPAGGGFRGGGGGGGGGYRGGGRCGR